MPSPSAECRAAFARFVIEHMRPDGDLVHWSPHFAPYLFRRGKRMMLSWELKVFSAGWDTQ